MTDSPRLEEVFAAVLAEHVTDFSGCACGWQLGDGPRHGGERRVHVAERLAARFKQVGWSMCAAGAHPGRVYRVEDGHAGRCPDCVPVFRLVGGDQ